MTYPLTAIVSDLHGNRPALDVAIADARARGVQRFVCLGDVVGYGADPRRCLDFVMDVCAPEPRGEAWGLEGPLAPGLCLLGNHEQALLSSPEDFNPKARAAIEWTRGALSDGGRERGYAYWDWLGGLEPVAVDERAQFAHGSPRDPVREYVVPRDAQDPAKLAALFAPMARGVCFVGHSHVPAVYYEDGRLFLPRIAASDDAAGPYALGAPGTGDLPLDAAAPRAIVNVGSVGQPRDGDPRLSYVLFDGANVTFVRLAYDIPGAQAAIRAVPELPEYLAERLERGR